MSLVTAWHAQSLAWTRVDRAPYGGDGFVLGVTEPTASNTGVLTGVSRTTYSGSTSITTDGQTFENMDFPNLMTVNAANVTFTNCYFSGSYSGVNGGGQVMCTGSACSSIRFERCTFRPTTVGMRYDAVYGHDFTAYRCYIEHTVDGFGVVNPNAVANNVHIEGCWIGNLSWYEDDTTVGAANSHADGTHNDGIQMFSGSHCWVVGNTFYGYKYNSLGTPTLYPKNQVSGGTANLYPQIGQIFLAQHSAYFQIPVTSNIHITNNFVYGGDNGIKFMSTRAASLGGGYASYGVDVQDNVWMDDTQRDWGGSHHWYPMRIDSNIIFNGSTQTGGTWITDSDTNNYSATSSLVDPVRQGDPVVYFCDAVPAG